ncbi:VOC family protein [Leptolyngbya sp. 7M]|uniref:VOC family protein n=1 Tax=Leptolyngbya sp. 7M TaxID=2812896 RepID=UPI001CEE02C9|nr:VOC family protein [Leptolyngbya sp. 7M]
MNLNQVTIYSSKTMETVEFFQKLGLRLIVDSLPRYARLECTDGEATLSVNVADEKPVASDVVIYFECEDLDAEVERLERLGLEFADEPEEKEWLWREAYLNDPNGNSICLFYAGENRKNPPWRVE